MAEVIVLGAGVIGLAIAAELAGRGVDVVVLERGAVGRGASWAAGGMLAPFTEDLEPGPLRDLALASLQMYPAYAAALQEASGVDIQLSLNGIIEVAFDEAHYDRLRRRVAGLKREGQPAELLDRQTLFEQEGAIGAQALGAAICYAEGQVENRRLGRALRATSLARGVRLRENDEVLGLETTSRRVVGVRTREGFLAGGYVVNALGAWAGQLAGVPASATIPVRPVKGQMLALALPKDFIEHVIWANGVYLIPRRDGRLMVGATVEEAGFDQRITAGGMQKLLSGVLKTVPGAATFALSETWSGHRPATLDGQLRLGATSLEGYFVAAGHYRNGILLAPITAQVVADLILRS